MSRFLLSISLLLSASFAFAASEEFPFEQAEQELSMAEREAAYAAWASDFEASLERQTGNVQLPGGIASLTVPSHFYYLSPKDADRVLTEAWGNPPGELPLGMLFPAAYSPLDAASWGVTIEYVNDGHVEDADAADIDYDAMLDDLISRTAEESKVRAEMGFGSLELLGWAASPYYDAVHKKIHWAQELRFNGAEENTLNYNLRVLGREGYLRLNFIAGMHQLSEIESNIGAVMDMTHFTAGNTYADFDPSSDKVAAYGVGALVAGGVLAKKGFFAAAAVLLIKFWKVLLVGLIGAGALFRKSAGKRSNNEH